MYHVDPYKVSRLLSVRLRCLLRSEAAAADQLWKDWSCWPPSADISKSSLWASCLVNDVLTVKYSVNFIRSVFSSLFFRCQGVKNQLLLPRQFHCFTSKPGLFSLKNSHFVLTRCVFLSRTPDCSTDSGFIQHIWWSLHVLACLICHFLALSKTHLWHSLILFLRPTCFNNTSLFQPVRCLVNS